MPYAPASAGYVPLPEAPLHDAAKKGAELVLNAEIAAIEHGDVPVEPLLVEGSPAPALLQAAKNAELLVVGSRGQHGFVELMLAPSWSCADRADGARTRPRPAAPARLLGIDAGM